MPPPRDTGTHGRFPHGENGSAKKDQAGHRNNDRGTVVPVATAINADAADTPEAAQKAPSEISVVEGEVPGFVGPALDHLYGTLYSSLSYFHTCGDLAEVSTYVERRNGVATAIFLFRRQGEKIRVLNEGMRLRTEDLSNFARHIFSTYRDVGTIVFHAVQDDGGKIPYVHHRSFCAEDFIARLPETQEAYLACLGAATRKNIKRHKNRLERDFPSFQCCIHAGHEADEGDIRRIIELNRIRMAKKGKASYIDDDETQRIIALVRQCGQVLVARIDGRVCGGTIFYRIGMNDLSKVNAHDPDYDSYRLGMICCYLAIADAIARGAAHFHLGHTRYEYKTALLGKFERFDHIVVYRSARHLLMHVPAALRQVLAGYTLQMNRWILLNIEQDNRFFWRLAKRTLVAWRAAKNRGA